jgi:hypothetical protein
MCSLSSMVMPSTCRCVRRPDSRPTGRAPRQRLIVLLDPDSRRNDQIACRHRCGQVWHDRFRCRRRRLPLANHDPAAVVEGDLPTLIDPAGAHKNDAGLAIAVLFQANHRRIGAERITRIDRVAKTAGRVAEVGDGIERDVRYGPAKDHVEGEQVVHRGARKAQAVGECVRELVAKRVPVSAVYSATSPSVMVRGVAWAIAWPTWKSSKKLPSLVFSLT